MLRLLGRRLELGVTEMKILLMNLAFSVRRCVLLILGSFVTSVAAQSAQTVEVKLCPARLGILGSVSSQ
jgi:hypothetical protein